MCSSKLKHNTDSWTPQRDRVEGNNGMASLKSRKRITSNLEVYIQGKYPSNMKGKYRHFWTNNNKKRERERKFVARIPTLKEMLKIVHWAEGKLSQIETWRFKKK